MSKTELQKAGRLLSENSAFIDVMRALHTISGFRLYVREGGEAQLARYNGKREVYSQLMSLLELSPEVMAKIEYHGVNKDANEDGDK